MKKFFRFTNWLRMSRRLLLMVVVFNLQSSIFNLHAQTIGEAFYIYRNDGQFNAFFRDEVDSIAYSHFDTDSIFYNEIVTQLVYTPDSLYRIPLASIDSIGFVQPETKYKENAVPLTGELFDYLIKADSLTLTFASYTPSALIPKIGEKLVATELTDKFPLGFTGLVRQVQQIGDEYEVVCDSLGLEEAVTQFYAVVEIVGQQADGSVRRYLPRRANSEQTRQFQLVIPTVNHQLDLTPLVKPKEVYDINGKAVANATIKPVITGRITRVVDNILNISHYNVHAVTDVATVTTIELVGEAVNSDNPLNLSSSKNNFAIEETKPGPYGIPIYYAFGPKFDLSGELALGTTVYANFSHTEDITFYPIVAAVGTVMPGLNPILSQINTVNGSTAMTYFDIDWAYIAGRISARVAVVGRLGIGIAAKGHNIGWVGAEAQIGAKAEAELGFDFEALSKAEKGTGFYEGLRDKGKVVVTPYWGLEGKVSLVDDRYQFKFLGRDDYTFWGKKLEWDFIPIFSDTKAVPLKGSSALATVNIINDCIIPYTVGFSLFDENNNRIEEPKWNEQKYRLYKDFNLPLKTTFTDLATNKKYKVYPSIKLFGFTVLASPSADLNMHFPVTLSDFQVTNKQHKEKGLTHEGVAYDYRFDVSVTATLDDEATDISDWGYVYLDPNGREAEISLKQFGCTYTDTRWAYFRNQAKSTCTLCGYVKYVGCDETVYGEPHDYPLEYGETTCPDANHPHMIDLGLPSGTKWACCNVGASAPEQYGNYYAWGETWTKTVYNDVSYSYITGQDIDGDGWIDENYFIGNIGSDIAGTGYDAAIANWGAPWRMPSWAQWVELYANCSSTWMSQNGVNGRMFTGPNCGTVYLPAAGTRCDSYLDSGGSYGEYWSSTLVESSQIGAHAFGFNFERAYGTYSGRFFGLSVRPVR